MFSIVIPTYNERKNIGKLISRINKICKKYRYEIIVVDDGSVDDTYEAAWSAIKSNRRKWPNIRAKVVKLSSTIGKEEAVQFGRNKATGEIVEIVNGDTSKF